jgi:hypothetical protein
MREDHVFRRIVYGMCPSLNQGKLESERRSRQTLSQTVSTTPQRTFRLFVDPQLTMPLISGT